MKRVMLFVFAFAMLLPLLAIAQDTKPDTQQPTATTTDNTMKEVTLSGKVGDDGKTFVSKDSKNWTISNPEALKGYEGQEVNLKAQVDEAKNAIQVVSVEKAKAEKTDSEMKPTGEQMPK